MTEARRLLHPVVATVREFVQGEVRATAPALDHADAYPHALVARMKHFGLFGALVPTQWGGLGLDVGTYAQVIEELCRGWMSLAGVINSHTMAALIVLDHGTDEQRRRLLPRFARGEARGGLALTEPHAGSDVQAIRTVARRDGDRYLVSGTKMFITNGREGNTFALLARTDPAAQPAHRGMSCFIVEKGAPGLAVAKSIGKLGYKGVDTVELVFEDFPVPADNLVGGVEGRGFKHVMSGLETGRINIAARAVGVAQAALDEALEATLGQPPRAEVTRRLHRMGARVEAARLLTHWAAAMKDGGKRCDLEAGMAKLYASECAQEIAQDALALTGPRSQLLSGTLERHYRDTPLMIIGEGANEIQKTLIARQLLDRHGERAGALGAHEGEAPERRQMLLTVRQVVDKEIAPAAAEHDATRTMPAAIRARVADLGVLGALAPAKLGGLELDLGAGALLIEELARGWGALAALVAGHLAAGLGVARTGARDRLLPAMTRGEAIAIAVAEPGVAARLAPGGIALDGMLQLVPGAALADLLVIRTADGSAAVVAAGAPGLTIEAPEPALGLHGLEPTTVRFTAVAVGADSVIESWDWASIESFRWLGAAAVAVGVAQAAFEAALRYSQQRTAFGKPICQHQAIQIKLADMASRIAAARLLTRRAAERLAADAADMSGAAMARHEAAETAGMVTLESMRIHGGYGYTTEFPVERYYRDVAALIAQCPS